MKSITDYIKESAAEKEAFTEKVRMVMDKAIADKSIDAWFFNWAGTDTKETRNAEKYINSILPGKWKFVETTGNGTNVGVGWFRNKDNGVTIGLSCDNEGETDNDYIDGYEIE